MGIEHARATVAGLVVVAAVACSPAAPLPAPVGSPLTATALRDSVRVSLTLEGPPLAGQLSWADGRVDNLGPKAVRWAGGGCNDPVGIFIEFARAFDPGRVWPGLFGRFKALSLGADGGSPTNIGYEEQSRIRPPDQIQIECPADLRVNELAPGASLSIRAAWNGTLGGPAPAPAGPATVTGWFAFIGIAGEVGDDVTTAKPIKAAIETTIAGPAAPAPDPFELWTVPLAARYDPGTFSLHRFYALGDESATPGRAHQEAARLGRPRDQDRGRPPGRRTFRRRGAVRQSARSRPDPWAGRETGRQPARSDVGRHPRREVERLALATQPPGQRSRGDRAGPQPDR